METRSRKKATVTFAEDEDIVHIIYPFGETAKLRNQKGNKPRRKGSCYIEEDDDNKNLSDEFDDAHVEDKSTVLCTDSEVTGSEMFGFETKANKSRLSLKVKESLEFQAQITPKSQTKATKRLRTPSVKCDQESSPFVTPTRKSGRKQTPLNTPQTKTPQTTPNDRSLRNRTPLNTPQEKTPSQRSTVASMKTPRSSQRKKEQIATPKSSQKPVAVEDLTKTPFNLRKRFQQKISKKMLTEELGLSSDSDYDVSDSDSDSSASDEEVEEDVEEEEEEAEEEKKEDKKEMKLRARQPARRQAEQISDELKFVIDADEFFRMDKVKSHTSNHTLRRLRTACLPVSDVVHTAGPHSSHTDRMLSEQKARYFQRWQFALAEGFSVLAYGAGSKRHVLEDYRVEMVDGPVVVCNGYFPSLTIKELCDSILEAAGGSTTSSTSDATLVDLVERTLRSCNVTLIVHNLDGPCIRVRRFQELIARLVSSNNLKLIASVDHINAPIMWDQTMLSQYNFTYWDCTSLVPYTAETAFEGSLLLQRSGALMLSAFNNVFRSLTVNAQGIYLVVVRYQLALSKGEKKSGMPFKDLYRRCREDLLVSSDLILRSQLTEFLDHKLVTCKRGPAGETLHIPLEDSLLQAFLQDRQQNEA